MKHHRQTLYSSDDAVVCCPPMRPLDADEVVDVSIYRFVEEQSRWDDRPAVHRRVAGRRALSGQRGKIMHRRDIAVGVAIAILIFSSTGFAIYQGHKGPEPPAEVVVAPQPPAPLVQRPAPQPPASVPPPVVKTPDVVKTPNVVV